MSRNPGFAATVKELFSRRTARGPASRRRVTTRRNDHRLETLEPRLAMAVATFFEPTSATLLASPGSNLYLTKVVGDELWAAESSTFVGRDSIPAISTRGTLAITTGVEKNDSDVEFAGFPMASGDTTFFVLSKTRVMDNKNGGGLSFSEGGELYGALTCVQPDGTMSTWTFSDWNLNNADPAFDLSQIRFTSGPGYGGTRTWFAASGAPTSFTQPKTGHYVPQSIEIANNSGDIAQQAAMLRIRWNQPLTAMQNVTIAEVRYDRAQAIDTGASVSPTPQIDRNLLPSAPERSAEFTLPGASEIGSLGIVPGTLSGTIIVDGVPLGFSTRRAFNQLYFDGGPAPTRGVLATADGSQLYVTGMYDTTGRLFLSFATRAVVGTGLSVFESFIPQAPGRVLVSANYGVSTTGSSAGDVTFFAGHDITNPIAVNVLTPGSTVRVESPLLSSGNIDINATNVNFASDSSTPGVLSVGAPNVVTTSIEWAALARAEINNGEVVRLIPVVGFEGSGYDADSVNIVSVAPPQSVSATATLSRVNGSVAKINLTQKGSGYATAPAVTISAPDQVNGVLAEAVAVIAAGAITEIQVTKPGSGYSFTPTITIAAPPPAAPTAPQPVQAVASAVIAGAILSIAVPNGGFGYTTAPAVSITSSASGSGATATATVTNGVVTSISINPGGGGTGYRFDTSTEITIAPPPQSNGTTATATAIVDRNTGQITGYTITNPGSGYGAVPTVTVAAPIPVAGAAATATISNGQVTTIAVTSTGYGYRTSPRVTISPPAPGTGGRAARATAQLDNEGRVIDFDFVDRGSGYDPAKPPQVFIAAPDPIAVAETASFNTTTAANEYRITLADDPNTDPRRGRMFVSQTSSLSRSPTAAAALLRVEAEQSDVIAEGRINATAQTYYLPSPPAAADLAPFTFTTRASSGQQTGLISGGDVQVILANDLPTPTDDTSVAFNVVDLKTDIGSLRLRAATRAGATRRDPFPYSITIDEANNLDVDAVAASSFPIVMLIAGSLNFNAALSTAGGMDLNVGDDFRLGAPIQTTKGRISFEADNLLLNNSVAVTATDEDDAKDDILLTARSGDIFVKSAISAVNRVRMTQRNRSNPQQAIRRYTGSPIAIPDAGTAVASIDLTDAINDFTFENLQVGISITHTFVSDLTATLISPAGTRITLFSGVGGGSDNFKDTVLDNEAPVAIWEGIAPFTGTFRPQQSLASLFGKNAKGTWRLEVRDSGGGDTGTIDAFSLIFRNSAAQEGKVFGTGRVDASSLDILAEGYVGNPDKTPIDPEFFLRTEVDELTARVAKSVAIDELTRINIPSLVAGGQVTVRANGFDGDASVLGDAQVAALKGEFLDIPAIDALAPNGSIDVKVITPNDLTIGNSAVIRADKALSMTAAGKSKIRASGGSNASSIAVLDAPLAGSGARQVRGVVSDPVAGAYSAGIPGTVASTISVSGSFAVPGVTDLRVGDRILIAGGASPAGAPVLTANGVYAVTSRSVASTVLTRATDSDTAAEMPNNTYVRVSGGSAVNNIYRLSYDASQPFAATPITVADVTSSLTTDIGSDDPNDLVSFVVSTDEGTNLAVGSLGKMLLLAAANRFEQKTELRFSADVGTIPLAEELPTINRKIDIDGSRRYGTAANVPTILIDGSKVGRRFDGSVVNSTTAVPGIQFVGAGSAGSRLANLAIGGFANDAAVSIDNTSEILVDAATLGKSAIGAKLGNKFGVLAKAGSTNITVSNSTIVSSGEAGVRAEGDATGIMLVGNTIGQNLFDNRKGVEFASTGVNHIGALALTNTPGSVVKDSPTITMPAGFLFENLFLGQVVTGTGLPADARVVAFNAAQRTITLSRPALAGGAEMGLSFSSPVRNTLQWNLYGARLANGTNRVVNSNVVNNVFAGIHIEGGVNSIGDSATRTAHSNDINLNQGWGILVEATSKAAAETLAANQTIRGNLFTPQGTAIGDATKQNRRGAIGIKAGDISTPLKDQVYPGVANALMANPLTGVDPNSNLHFAVADTRGPIAALEPVLNAGGTPLLDDNASPDIALIRFTAARAAKRFAVRISDDGSGIKRDTIVKESFTITREGVPLVEGSDYTFRFDGNEIAQFEAKATTFPLGTYVVTANSRKAVTGGQSGWLTDLDNNAMASSASFTISLADLPGKPTAVVAAAGDGLATVTWTAPTSVPAATDYMIEYRAAGGAWTAFADGTSAATSATVTGLANNVAHEFRVRAVNSAGQGEFSDASAPVTPRTPAAAPSITGETVGNAQATVTWTTPADNGSPIKGYALEYSATGSAPWARINLEVSNSHTVTGLMNGTSYSFRVAAVTDFGVGSFSSIRLVNLHPGAPGSILAQPRNQSALLSWPTPTPNGNLPITSYSVEMSADNGQSWTQMASTNGNSTTVNGLSNGVNYLFRVAATNRGGTGPVSPVGAVTPRTLAAAPTITTATAGGQQVALAWTVPANNGSPIVRYVVDFSSDGGGSWTRREGNASPSAVITGLANGTSYVFRVAAVNAENVGAFSAQTGQITPLGAPSGIFATASNRSAWLIWTAADAGNGSAVTAYRIEMSTDGGNSWAQAAVVAGSANSARIQGLVNGTGYTFRVAAVANQSPGPFSGVSSEVFPAVSVGAPTRVTATLSNGAVSLRWTAPRFPRGVTIDDYAVQYSTDNGVSWRVYEDGISTATRTVVTGLPNGAQYQFRVAAVTGDLIGEVSAATRPILLFDRRATPTAPANLRGTASGSIYSLQWNAVAGNAGGAVTDYVIQYRVNSARGSRWVTFRDPVAAATSATLTRLTNRTGYVFRVAAKNLAGIGAYSSEFTIQ